MEKTTAYEIMEGTKANKIQTDLLNKVEIDLPSSLDNVITSYSIHYTKLYENPETQIVLTGMQIPPNMGPEYTAEFRNIFPELMVISPSEHSPHVFVVDSVFLRITSYNVCYTKLLRHQSPRLATPQESTPSPH